MAQVHKIVLIAEDNSDEIFILKRVFSKTGLPYELRFVSNGREAIDYLSRRPPYDDEQTCPPFAVVLDLNMPLMGGFEVLEWMNAHPTFKDLPVIIHTTSDLPSDRQRAKQLGASAYIVKSPLPSELSVLFITIAQSNFWPRSSVTAKKRGAVLLRNSATGLYFAGCEQWVSDPAKALDFEFPERAAQFSRERAIPALDMVIVSPVGTEELAYPASSSAVTSADSIG